MSFGSQIPNGGLWVQVVWRTWRRVENGHPMSSHQHHFLWDSSRKTWDIIGSEAWEPPYFTFFVSEEQLRGAPPWSHTGETGNQRPSTCRTKIGLDWSASSAFFSPVFRWFFYGSIHKSWFFYGFSMVFLGSQRIHHLGPSGIIPKGTWRCCWSKPWGMSQWSSWGLFEKSLAAWKKRCSRSYIVYVCICGFHCFCSC